MKCFAHNENSPYAKQDADAKKPLLRIDDEICYALSSEGYAKMKAEHKCDTARCPFFKQTRAEIRKEEW